jgi:hypothetical protein
VHVEVHEARGSCARDRADADGAVAPEDDRREAGRDRGSDELRHVAHRLGHLLGVLRGAVLAVGAPAAERDVPEVVGVQPLDEPGLTQRAGGVLLPGRERAEARGCADHRERHNRCS